MNEVKNPKRPMIFYYILVIIALVLFNSLILPLLTSPRVQEVDYGTFMTMTDEQKVDQVDLVPVIRNRAL